MHMNMIPFKENGYITVSIALRSSGLE